MVETEARAGEPSIESWSTIPWRELERRVYRLQKRIYRAQARGNVRAVHSLQRLLMKSWSARALAVRRVTQDNHGKKTAGVDGVKAVGPLIRLLFVETLRDPRTIKARPVRRVLIPKPGKPNEVRPLGIPVMLDRAHQALVKRALEPQWEARFEPNSYGFRPGRSCHDALQAVFTSIGTKAKYALDADIKGCFENIGHAALLAKLDAPPALRQAVKAWLKAGVLSDGVVTPTPSGSPQGGVISPLLMNVALHGLEGAATATYRKAGTPVHLIRYADDLVVLCADLEGIAASREAVERWLAGMGLHLSPTKTRVTHTLHPHDGNVGFDFLGCTVRQYPRGRCQTGRNTKGQPLGFKTFITPSKKAIARHLDDLGTLIRRHRTVSQEALIGMLNPRIRGWTNYHRAVVATDAFQACDHHVVTMLLRWGARRHPNKSMAWVVNRYWHTRNGRRWVFTTPTGVTLRAHSDTHIKRHVKVKGRASPFDGDLIYWAKRLRDHPLTGSLLGRLLVTQGGRCADCGLLFRDDDCIEIDHMRPSSQAGPHTLTNMQALHRHCHDRKSARDGSYQRIATGTHDTSRQTEEPDDANVSRPVLKAGGRRRLLSPS